MAPKRKKVPLKSLLDVPGLTAALLAACTNLNDKKAESHAKRIAHQAFHHEKQKVHAKLYKDAMELHPVVPVGKCNDIPVTNEFHVSQVVQLPRQAYAALDDWALTSSKVVHVSESKDYVTTKLLIELANGERVETVILRHSKRTTLCVSSQVGCDHSCSFCATGRLDMVHNLAPVEIVEQIVHANRFLKTAKEERLVRGVTMMGMGEPLSNYHNVVQACRMMVNTSRFSLAPHRITVSTVGVTSRMRTLYNDVPGVSLALSLHAPNQEVRKKIIPTATAYKLPQLMEAVRAHLDTVKAVSGKPGHIMIEYLLIRDVNCSRELAEELAQLLQPVKDEVKINCIPYNPIFAPDGMAKTFKAPSDDEVLTFKSILQDKHGMFTTIRTEMGQDVNGACGQLACISKDAKELEVDIEDLYKTRVANELYDKATGENRKKKKATAKKWRRSEGGASLASLEGLAVGLRFFCRANQCRGAT